MTPAQATRWRHLRVLGLRAGDLLVGLDERPFEDPADMRARLDAARGVGRLLIERAGARREVPVDLDRPLPLGGFLYPAK